MSNLSWEAPGCILWAAEQVVNEHSPYRDNPQWAETKRYHASYACPIIYAMQQLPTGSRVLDVGAGYGTLAVAARLLGHEVQAVDLFLQRMDYDGLAWWRGNVCEPGVFDGWAPFDLVIMAEVLEHLTTDPAEAFANVAAALKPGGVFVGSTPTPGVWPGDEPCSGDLPKWTPEAVPQDKHVRLYSQAEVAELLAGTGFAVETQSELCDPPVRHLWIARKVGA